MLTAMTGAIRKALRYGAIVLLGAVGMSGASHAQSELPVVVPAVSCAALNNFDLATIGGAGSRIVSSSETKSDGIAVCFVEGVLAPAIRFQLLLPMSSWTQRYLQIGCGGLCGRITLQSGASNGCRVLNAGGFAMAATDMGHGSDDDGWLSDPQKQIDFAYRAQHLTAEAAKTLIQAFYGQAPRYSYFNGCSDGGREALMEAQRYPKDFDGIIAGAPAMLFQVQNTLYHGWQAVSNTRMDGTIILLSHKLPALHKAVIEACDAIDGVTDGLIAAPAACRFDLTTVTCKPGTTDTTTCLTPDEAEVARRFYDGPKDERTGARLTAGQPLYGSELNWQGVYVADTADSALMSSMAALPVLRLLAFTEAKPAFRLRDLAFAEPTLATLRRRHPLFDATNSDLTAFARAGGKLILWHGLADPHIAPANTVALHTSMIRHLGAAGVDAFERLYLLPGVSRCGGG